MSAALDGDYAAMAQDELARALRISWRDLSGIIPWGDTFEGVSPAGRDVLVESSYIWADKPGGDILCEVVVYGGPSRYEDGARASATIAKGGRR